MVSNLWNWYIEIRENHRLAAKSILRYTKGSDYGSLDAHGDDASLVSYSNRVKTDEVIKMKENAQMGMFFILVQPLFVNLEKRTVVSSSCTCETEYVEAESTV